MRLFLVPCSSFTTVLMKYLKYISLFLLLTNVTFADWHSNAEWQALAFCSFKVETSEADTSAMPLAFAAIR